MSQHLLHDHVRDPVVKHQLIGPKHVQNACTNAVGGLLTGAHAHRTISERQALRGFRRQHRCVTQDYMQGTQWRDMNTARQADGVTEEEKGEKKRRTDRQRRH